MGPPGMVAGPVRDASATPVRRRRPRSGRPARRPRRQHQGWHVAGARWAHEPTMSGGRRRRTVREPRRVRECCHSLCHSTRQYQADGADPADMLVLPELHKRTPWLVVILPFSGFQGGSTGSNPVGGANTTTPGSGGNSTPGSPAERPSRPVQVRSTVPRLARTPPNRGPIRMAPSMERAGCCGGSHNHEHRPRFSSGRLCPRSLERGLPGLFGGRP